MEKQFFWKDKTGRGFTNEFTEQGLINAFEGDEDHTEDWNGVPIREFAEEAEVGDRWENATHEVTRIK